MQIRLKPINEQVIVITGASSGIGLATARLAARQGAAWCWPRAAAAISTQLVDELDAAGRVRPSASRPTSATRPRCVALPRRRCERFGGFDTWVNNAGVSVYGPCLTVPLADMRRLFDTNVWGVIHGSRDRRASTCVSRGGALINVGSEVSDKAVPLQGAYSASKHAVRAGPMRLRMELEQDGAPVSVTLIKPGPIDTPVHGSTRRTTSRTSRRTRRRCTRRKRSPRPSSMRRRRPVRDLFVGGGRQLRGGDGPLGAAARPIGSSAASVSRGTHSGRPRRSSDALYQAGGGLQERGDYDGHRPAQPVHHRSDAPAHDGSRRHRGDAAARHVDART